MLTPQEVSERAFAKASFGGYNMAMVDEFLDQLTGDYTQLYKENAGLKSKMKVLVDKVEEYRATEDAMRRALLAAQQMADQMIAEAEEKRQRIEADAEAQVREKVEGYRHEVETEQARLAAAKAETAAYVSKVKALVEDERSYLDHLEELVPTVIPAAPVESAAFTPAAPVVEEADEEEEVDDTMDDTKELPHTKTEKPGGLYQDLTGFGMHTPKKPDMDATRTMPPIQDRDYQIK